ncbi:transcriptional regulator with XRE-family HTH domain [Lederbergia wuyishanensis]|uniref:Transcriptional regulator with XRE-family HTH domain n=1 Tax=Lederbergia wuyishanensis TaxID=1347903 RepID=A0ABU0D769_9BACI|nr:transcriptional regulator with XRE-family HTH domain [Lederbergia wuyishanensis]
MEDKKILGERLKSLRGKRTQEEVANLLGLSRARYSHYENNRVEPDTEILNKLADFYNVTTDYLLGRTINPDPIRKDEEVESLLYYKNKIVSEFPDIDLMFKDMETLTAEDMKEVYEYIKFKMSQKKDD